MISFSFDPMHARCGYLRFIDSPAADADADVDSKELPPRPGGGMAASLMERHG